MDKIWEDLVSLNSDKELGDEVLGLARDYQAQDERKDEFDDLGNYQASVEADKSPLPITENREGYWGPHHFSYWLSGLRDARNIVAAAQEYGLDPKRFLDIGCATGRVMRHFANEIDGAEIVGCDINRLHVEWCNRHLPDTIRVFHNSSIPSLPLASNSFDVVSAFSVFTHIEAFETGWLMEIERVLRPGGIAWLTVHTENTLMEMEESWPLWKAVMNHPDIHTILDKKRQFDGDRAVIRWRNDRSYASNVFYKEDYLRSHWGRFFTVLELRRRFPLFQDVMILQKRRVD